jgi:excisionase family DNA binding protein
MPEMSQTPAPLAHSIDEACEASDLGRTKIYEEIQAGRLKARKVGRRTLILHKDLEAYLAALPEIAAA